MGREGDRTQAGGIGGLECDTSLMLRKSWQKPTNKHATPTISSLRHERCRHGRTAGAGVGEAAEKLSQHGRGQSCVYRRVTERYQKTKIGDQAAGRGETRTAERTSIG